MVPLLVALVAPAWAVDCPVSAAKVQELDAAVETAFSALNEDALETATADLDQALGCLAQPIPAALAAETHRAFAFSEYVQGDRAGAREAFAAARSIEPGYEIPETLLPPKHPLRALYAEALKPGATGIELPGAWLVDGLRANALPSDRPAILQRMNDSGLVVFSAHTASIRAADAELTAIEADIPTIPAGPDSGADLLGRLARIQGVQMDCRTLSHALYDSGVVYTHEADANAAAAAFQGTIDRGTTCAADYASRAKEALKGKGLRQHLAAVRAKPTFYRFSVGLAASEEVGTHTQFRDSTVGLNDDGTVAGTSSWEYSGFGAGGAGWLDARVALFPALELGISGGIQQVQVVQGHTVTCSGVCDGGDSLTTRTIMFEGSTFANFVIAGPQWHVQPVFEVGAMFRTIPKTASSTGSVISNTDTTTVTYPAFSSLLIPGLTFGPGLRFRLARFGHLDLTSTIVSLGDTSTENIDASIESAYTTPPKGKFAFRLGIRASVGF